MLLTISPSVDHECMPLFALESVHVLLFVNCICIFQIKTNQILNAKNICVKYGFIVTREFFKALCKNY